MLDCLSGSFVFAGYYCSGGQSLLDLFGEGWDPIAQLPHGSGRRDGKFFDGVRGWFGGSSPLVAVTRNGGFGYVQPLQPLDQFSGTPFMEMAETMTSAPSTASSRDMLLRRDQMRTW